QSPPEAQPPQRRRTGSLCHRAWVSRRVIGTTPPDFTRQSCILCEYHSTAIEARRFKQRSLQLTFRSRRMKTRSIDLPRWILLVGLLTTTAVRMSAQEQEQ